MAWRFLTFDMKTFQPTSELPEVADPGIQYTINQPEQFSVTVPIQSTKAFYINDPTLFLMPNAGLAVEKDGVLIAAGPIRQHNYDFKGNTCTLTAHGIYREFEDRIYYDYGAIFNAQYAVLPYVPAGDVGLGWDQAFIAKYFVDKLQSADHGWLNIDTSGIQSTNSGYRNYTIWGYQLKDYFAILQDRADIINGFDFRFTPRWKNSVRNSEIEWQFEIFYPPSGRPTNLTFQLGANCDFASATIDGNQIAYRAYSQGASQQNTTLIGMDQDTQYIAANRLLEYVDREHTDVNQIATANDYAQQARKRRMKPSNIPSINITIDDAAGIVIGDQCRIIADYGIYSLDETFRIMKMGLNPKTNIATLEVSPLALNGN